MNCPICSRVMMKRSQPPPAADECYFSYHCRADIHDISFIHISCDYCISCLTERPIHLEIKRILDKNLVQNYVEYYVDHKTEHAYSVKEMSSICKLKVF